MSDYSKDFDPSEFASSDELNGEYEEYLDEFHPEMTDEEVDDMYMKIEVFEDEDKPDLWGDLGEVNNDDIPY